MQKPSRTEFYLFYNNMVCLVKALEGKYTTVDLRNESYVSGRITEVDGFMNIEMEDCTFYNPRGSVLPFETFFVKARNIRYVHIPKDLEARKLIEDQIQHMKTPRVRPPQVRTYKDKRSKQYQAEIEKELRESSEL